MGIKHCLLEVRMSEDHMDEFEHYNYEMDKHVNLSGHSGKQRSKREAELNTNRPNPGGHERKILTKLMNAEKNNQAANNKTLFVNYYYLILHFDISNRIGVKSKVNKT